LNELSTTQQELYDAMKSGVVVHFMPYAGRFNPNEYFFRNDTMKRCTAAAHALCKKGLATIEGGWNTKKLVLKDHAA
jgi:hypothetical protein